MNTETDRRNRCVIDWPRSSAGFAGAIPGLGGGREERAVRRATTVGQGARGGVAPSPKRGTKSPSESPRNHLVGLEDLFEQAVPGELLGHTPGGDAGRHGRGGAGQQRQCDEITRRALMADHLEGQRGIAGLEQMEDAGHQNTMKRRACRSSAPMSARETSTTGWRLSFQSGSVGTAVSSTWNGTSSRLRFSRNLAMSSPSTSSSVSASSRCTAGPRSTKVTSFSPATTPTPMASKARPEVRGSTPITTTTGWGSGTSVQRDEAVGAVDQVGQYDQAAV